MVPNPAGAVVAVFTVISAIRCQTARAYWLTGAVWKYSASR
jgi:hypothetical protein